MTDELWKIVVAALIGLIFGGAGTTFFGLIPVRHQIAEMRVSMAEKLGEIETEIAAIKTALDERTTFTERRRRGDG